MSSELMSHSMSMSMSKSMSMSMSMNTKEQMRNLVELEEKCKINIDKAIKNIGICKCKSASRCKFGQCKFDPDVLFNKSMLCNIKIAQIDITKAEQDFANL